MTSTNCPLHGLVPDVSCDSPLWEGLMLGVENFGPYPMALELLERAHQTRSGAEVLAVSDALAQALERARKSYAARLARELSSEAGVVDAEILVVAEDVVEERGLLATLEDLCEKLELREAERAGRPW